MQRVHLTQEVPCFGHVPPRPLGELRQQADGEVNVVPIGVSQAFLRLRAVLRGREVDAAQMDRGRDVVRGDEERLLETLHGPAVVVEREVV